MTPPFVQPYLFFGGHCGDALAYYKQHLGAEVLMTMRFGESPEPAPPGHLPEGWEDKVMHCAFRIGGSVLMGSDGMSRARKDSEGGEHCLSLTLPDETAARRAFDALALGGTVFMPIGRTFWSPCFGMVTDRFGIAWMVTVPEMTK